MTSLDQSSRAEPPSLEVQAQSIAFEQELFTPGLQAALQAATERQLRTEAVLNGAFQGFGEFLVSVLGRKNAAAALRDFADHLESQG